MKDIFMNLIKDNDYYSIEIKAMRKYFLFILVAFIAVSCGADLEKIVEDTHPDGTPRLVHYYKNDDGIREKVKVEAFYEDGSKRYTGEYADGKRNGYWVYWYENGNMWSEGYFKDDLRDGFGTTWHKNGQKNFEGAYKEGIRVGMWKFWTPQGELIKELDYDQ
jgi:antitoxin component YwqK of YwqJK toxin-antitoxin module